MNDMNFEAKVVGRKRLSLEQKIIRLVRRYRAAEKRRQRRHAARSQRNHMGNSRPKVTGHRAGVAWLSESHRQRGAVHGVFVQGSPQAPFLFTGRN